MTDDGLVHITDALAIPRAELEFRATRSGGPGGQHVNTSSTRIELVWDVATSPSLDDDQREHLLARLANRLDAAGRLRLVAQAERSQLQNREAALARFVTLVRQGLVVPKRRRATRPTKASKERRLKAKRERGAIKRERRRKGDED